MGKQHSAEYEIAFSICAVNYDGQVFVLYHHKAMLQKKRCFCLRSYSVESKRYTGLNSHGIPAVQEVKKALPCHTKFRELQNPSTQAVYIQILVLKEKIKTANRRKNFKL